MATLDQDDIDIITSIIHTELLEFKTTGEVLLGQGRGSVHYTDAIYFGNGISGAGTLVRAYPVIDNTANFSELKAMDMTDSEGVFDLWLNPGSYILRLEKHGVSLDSIEIVIT